MLLRLQPFPAELAGVFAGWAATGDETTLWCGRPTARSGRRRPGLGRVAQGSW